MKPLLLILLLIAVVAAYMVFGTGGTPTPTATPAVANPLPVWEQPIPEGTELVPDGQAKLHVQAVRRNENDKSYLDFQITEEHGYLVDGVRVVFWFRFKDEDTGEWIEDTKRIDYFIRDRLPFNETLVASTILRDLDFREQGIDLPATVSEDWGAEVTDYLRAIRSAN